MTDAVDKQRNYYARTAEHYNSMHVGSADEHGLALAAFAGLCQLTKPRNVLDVGAGTGRAIDALTERLPDTQVLGVEPVAALREIGHARGIATSQLIDGDAQNLPFADDEFDYVIETGVLHHVPRPDLAVREMVRVARIGVMISDANKFGQGSALSRALKAVVGRLGLWNVLIWAQTRGKMYKWSEGDGLYYSYSVFDNIETVKAKFPFVQVMNTWPMSGYDARRGAGQVMLYATRGAG